MGGKTPGVVFASGRLRAELLPSHGELDGHLRGVDRGGLPLVGRADHLRQGGPCGLSGGPKASFGVGKKA